MIYFAQRQLHIANKSGLIQFQDNVSQEQWILGSHSRRWPIGSVYYFALQQVYVPADKRFAQSEKLDGHHS